MNQQTLAGFEKYGKTTRRAQFLAEMEQGGAVGAAVRAN
jgi:hypothetical protein